MGTTGLLSTGRGRSRAVLPGAAELSAFDVYDSLLEAVTSRLASDPSPRALTSESIKRGGRPELGPAT